MIKECGNCRGIGVVGITETCAGGTCPTCNGSGYTGTTWNDELKQHMIPLDTYLEILDDMKHERIENSLRDS